MTNKYAVPALDKGLDILEFLATQEAPLSQAEIALALERSSNEIYRVLIGLESRGYLYRNSESAKYVMSLKLYTLSRRISPLDRIRRHALPLMEDLAFNCGQSCYLSMLYQSQSMVIVNANNHGPITLAVAEGVLSAPSRSAAGQILLANSKPTVQAMILERDDHFNELKNEEKSALYLILDQTKKDQYAVAESSFLPGITEISTLIGKPDGQIVASLTIPMLPTQTKTAPSEQLKQAMIQTAKQISLEINNG
ncbi:IclR family transcriptional regulator [Vibrio sp. 10N.286.49.C2]|uniref:IclR family transcriptional regulator n=1 Tax=unclassified Vibrio TaxID=2614977 RepID=UPI000C864390|nr:MULTISPECIES: IclR family transcriptional regulator [unclassified Vibrio]PMH26389.1 IclR family transcriptional regulator [Vibrio sp. 10N.286.49.C2]PMH54887.1 IclR family transcriptional regulator [Vibrio sp. 10N.286.49.B1]PMH79585.1 IclR family transcriptional regulator [Vibrio sp. 10N.286.48.B7]